jgi:ATP-dependent exoDNAse (exonuclease V) beta subunit
MGIFAHTALERLQFDATTKDEIRQLIDQLGIPAGLDSSERATMAADLVRYMAKFATSVSAAREVPFFYHVGEALFLRGQIDALIVEGARVIVRDYKYAHVADEGLYRLQMEAYALVLGDAYPHSSVEAEIVFLRDDSVIVPVALPPLPRIRARVSSIGHEIVAAQTSGDFPRKPPNATVCSRLHCGYVKRCWGG